MTSPLSVRVEVIIIPPPGWRELLKAILAPEQKEPEPECVAEHEEQPGHIMEQFQQIDPPSHEDPPAPAPVLEIKYIKQIDRIKDEEYISKTPQTVPNFKNLTYQETKDGRLHIIYSNYQTFTTWDEVERLLWEQPELRNYGGYLDSRSKNKQMGFNQFVKSVKAGSIKRYQDPDKDFKPFGIRTSIYPPPNGSGDFGKVEEV